MAPSFSVLIAAAVEALRVLPEFACTPSPILIAAGFVPIAAPHLETACKELVVRHRTQTRRSAFASLIQGVGRELDAEPSIQALAELATLSSSSIDWACSTGRRSRDKRGPSGLLLLWLQRKRLFDRNGVRVQLQRHPRLCRVDHLRVG